VEAATGVSLSLLPVFELRLVREGKTTCYELKEAGSVKGQSRGSMESKRLSVLQKFVIMMRNPWVVESWHHKHTHTHTHTHIYIHTHTYIHT
jgi:hypothetical protein